MIKKFWKGNGKKVFSSFPVLSIQGTGAKIAKFIFSFNEVNLHAKHSFQFLHFYFLLNDILGLTAKEAPRRACQFFWHVQLQAAFKYFS